MVWTDSTRTNDYLLRIVRLRRIGCLSRRVMYCHPISSRSRIRMDATESDQHAGVVDVVLLQVVGVRVGRDQFVALIEVHADHQRVGFR
jgi:hypothetical protein